MIKEREQKMKRMINEREKGGERACVVRWKIGKGRRREVTSIK